jgi:hypothetical protein
MHHLLDPIRWEPQPANSDACAVAAGTTNSRPAFDARIAALTIPQQFSMTWVSGPHGGGESIDDHPPFFPASGPANRSFNGLYPKSNNTW